MAEQKYLIDTNAIIDYLGRKLPPSGMDFIDEIFPETSAISIISKIELLGFTTSDKYYQILIDFTNDAQIIELEPDISEKSISLRKGNRIKIPDAIIAATALSKGLTLVTRNVRDFEKMKDLKVINPHTISQ